MNILMDEIAGVLKHGGIEGRQPESKWRHRLLERLSLYLARSPVSQQAMAREFFGRNIKAHRVPGFAHDARWHSTGALKWLLSKVVQNAAAKRDVTKKFLDGIHADSPQWCHLSQDQNIEIRAPDALTFVAKGAPDNIDEVLSDSALKDANVFEPQAVTQLLRKCRARGNEGQFSNMDNMALIGALSTQLLHWQFTAGRPDGSHAMKLSINIDKSSNPVRC